MTPPPSGDETRDALAAVLADQAERTTRRNQGARPTERSALPAWAAASVLAGLALWLWLAPPSFLRPPPVPSPSPEAVATGLHMDIYTAAIQVLAYETRHGRLPRTLSDALAEPDFAQGLAYEVAPDGTFEITGARRAERVTYRSHQPLEAWVAAARRRVRTRGVTGGSDEG